MALIILSGLPSSGKTHRASQIDADFAGRIAAEHDSPAPSRNLTLHAISDHTAKLPRSVYAAAGTEKTARATLYSTVKRALGRDAVVVLDSGNYIKGWRYQLHCEAKAAGVRSCVVHIGTPPDAARQVNAARSDGTVDGAGTHDRYAAALWEEIAMRFEEPNAMARWDSPLYTVAFDDPAPPCERIWREVVMGLARDGSSLGAVKRNQATVAPAPTAGSHLQELERLTQAVTAQIVAEQARRVEGGAELGGVMDVEVDGRYDAGQLNLPVGGRLTQPHLQRLRRQFVTLHRQQMGGLGMGAIGKGDGKGGLVRERLATLFVDWLNDAFARGS